MRVFRERLAAFDLRRPQRKREYNRRLFRAVAPRYAAVTRLLSFGMDGWWKRALVSRLPRGPGAWSDGAAQPGTGAARPSSGPARPSFGAWQPQSGVSRPQSGVSPRALDLACGTGDITLLLARRFPAGRIEGLDLSAAMLARARRRFGANEVRFRVGDLGHLPYPAGSFHLVTGGYALRNAPDLGQALREILRVLQRGGTAAFLDFNRSPVGWVGRLQVRLLALWGGIWGLLLHGNPEVYAYIARTLALFPDRARFEALLRELGFRRVRSRLPPGGFVSLTFARKP